MKVFTIESSSHCDNTLSVYRSEDGGVTETLVTSNPNFNIPTIFTLDDVTRATQLRYQCVGAGGPEAFIATIDWNGNLYSTVAPLMTES
eukprot:CAMPEP_0202718410 /NCGR_PEP_ID=MMETSP1385-20130828/121693_1 /ASSEMBLY_ACC=CAM_ASM_000861 /TAXON_ID=933848 /ORGANISM="Elphidium margaritaceum" /LENGTH=88 /DNA_ID=CAMNT_0049381113 /DNA_START=40 /DNA_END=302 /DNA_ORIENTATION=-